MSLEYDICIIKEPGTGSHSDSRKREAVPRISKTNEEGWSVKRFTREGLSSFCFAVAYPKFKKGHRIVAGVCNKLLMISFLPILFVGLFILKSGYWAAGYEEMNIIWVYFLSLIPAMTFHEFAHAAATLAYGGKVHEFGVMVSFFVIPGAYVKPDYENVKSRFQRAQIVAAGVEMNLFLAGLSLCLMIVPWVNSYLMLTSFLTNLMLALGNLALVHGIDGMHIFSEMMGTDNLILDSVELILDKKECRKMKKRGINGRAGVLVSRLVLGLQLLLPVIMIVNVAVMFYL